MPDNSDPYWALRAIGVLAPLDRTDTDEEDCGSLIMARSLGSHTS